MGRINNIAWRSGLNPYNYLDDCYGGADFRAGVLREDEYSVHMIAPGAMPVNRRLAAEYMEVRTAALYCLLFSLSLRDAGRGYKLM